MAEKNCLEGEVEHIELAVCLEFRTTIKGCKSVVSRIILEEEEKNISEGRRRG